MSGEAMPIGRRGWGWARARYAAASRAGKRAIVAAISVAVVIVLIAAIVVVAGKPASQSTASPSDLGAVMGNQDAETPQISPQITPSVTPQTTLTVSPSPDPASPSPTLADADDEVAVDSSPGAATTAGPTGVPVL